MSKTLVIAEKPSVGRDLANALPGAFAKDDAYLESDDYVVTWAVGHLVELAEPDDYDERFKKWRMADLPIIPEEFKLKPRDAKGKKQLNVIHKLLKRTDVDRVINACDSGREGELIFAYIWETAGVDKPVERLWISSMTKQAIGEGFEKLRPGEQMAPLERAARSRSEADWLVGMNATRAGTIRGRAWVGGVVSLGRVQTPTLALMVKREREIQAFVPEPYWLVHGTFEAPTRAGYEGMWFEGDETRLKDGARADAIVTKVSGKDGTVASVERKEQSERAPLLYDLTSLQRDANRRFGFSARRTLQAAQSLYEDKKALTYPRTSSRYLTGDMVPFLKPTAETLVPISDYAPHARFVLELKELPLSRVVNDARVDDHHAIIPTDVEHDVSSLQRRRAPDLRPRRAAVPRRVPSGRPLRAHDGRHRDRERAVPHARQGDARGRLARRVRHRGRRQGERPLRGGRRGRRAAAPRGGHDDPLRRGRERGEGDEAAAPLLRGDAPLRHGDRRQADRRRGAARGDEGQRPRNAGHARRGDRDAHPPRVHRARLQGAPPDTKGSPGGVDVGGPSAALSGADGRLGEAPARHRARNRRPRRSS